MSKELSFFEKKYKEEIIPQLQKNFGHSNIMSVAKVKKVVLNIGLGQEGNDKKALDAAVAELALIAGQKPVVTKAKKSIAAFKLRQGQNIGTKVTLRGRKMWEFIERLVFSALPRVKDFKGLSVKGFDKNFNYSFGIKEHLVFQELTFDKILRSRGLDVIVNLSSSSKEESLFLLKSLFFPIK